MRAIFQAFTFILSQSQEFEVEVVAEEEGAWLKVLESVVVSDPRWQMLASKGILKAQWSGFHLKLGPLDEQELASNRDCNGIDSRVLC